MGVAAVTDAGREPDALPTRPWWTEADAGELDALVWELVEGVFTHRDLCTLEQPCRHIRAAVEVVVDWRKARELRSYARWVRHQRDLIELEEDKLVHRLRGAR